MINKNLVPTRQLVFHFQLQDLWGILFLGYAFLNSGSPHYSDIQAFYLIMLGILYFAVRMVSGLSQYFQLVIVLGLIFYLLGQVLLGFSQVYGYTISPHITLRMSGDFENLESYAGLLACLFPLSLSIALRINSAPSKRYFILPILAAICSFLLVSLIPAGMNPCCWLVAGVGGYAVIIYHFRTIRCYKLLLWRYPKRVIFSLWSYCS